MLPLIMYFGAATLSLAYWFGVLYVGYNGLAQTSSELTSGFTQLHVMKILYTDNNE